MYSPKLAMLFHLSIVGRVSDSPFSGDFPPRRTGDSALLAQPPLKLDSPSFRTVHFVFDGG
jgi:hypothetical protein